VGESQSHSVSVGRPHDIINIFIYDFCAQSATQTTTTFKEIMQTCLENCVTITDSVLSCTRNSPSVVVIVVL